MLAILYDKVHSWKIDWVLTKIRFKFPLLVTTNPQSELPRPFPWNSVESHLGCTCRSRIYLDNVTLTLHKVTLTSQKPYHYNNKCDCSKTSGYE